ncbi:MAG TPA: TonB-dependent receptor [Candidatus Acidoferrales bacterium]|nr:TonB-dependent receptor [Candidatus Acidoferrales bacterium]
MGRIRIVSCFLLFGALVACAAGPVWAQEATGRIVGNVSDRTGSVIARAKVTVTNEATQVSETATTGKDGFYQVLSLPIGTYSVAIEMTGFRKQVFEHQLLQINQSLRLDAKLEIGARSEVVEVTSQAPNVETINPTLGESVTSRPLVNLPLNGRNTLDLALLQPGVMEANPDYVGDARAAGSFSVGGGRPDSITYLLDGGVNNDILSNGVVYNPNPDSVAEFRILTSNYTAEYGRNGAGVISVATKSGTNTIHGSVFEFLRNGDFNANTFFNKIEGLPRDNLHRNQYGATLGGPITIPHVVNGKDRFFFFVAYQGQRQVQTVTQSLIPTFTPAELQGDFSHAVPNGSGTCATAGGCPDPSVMAFLQNNLLFATPPGGTMAQAMANAALAIIDPTKINAVSAKVIAAGLIPTSPTGLYSAGAGSANNNNELTGKMDFVIDQKDNLTVTLGGFRNPQLAPFGLNGADVVGYPSTDQVNNYFGSVAYTRNFTSHVLNEFRFTAQRHNFQGDLPAATLPPPSSYGFGITPDLPNGPPQLLFDSGLQTGFSAQGPRFEISNAYSYTDTVSWVKGRNTWKFGAGLAFYQTNIIYDFYGTGQFYFLGPYASGGIGTGNSFADFDLGIPQSLFEGPNAANNLRSKAPYGFVQDEWRVRSNLTLTLGVRFEYSEPKTDTEGRTFSIIPGLQSTRFPNAPLGLVFPGDKGAPSGANFPDKTNFAPRIGFAWDPWKDGKTSIRGGFGIFYDILKGEDNLQFNGAPPFYSETGPIFNGGALVGPGVAAPFTFFSNPWTSYPGGSPFPSTPPTSSLDFVNAGFIPYNYGSGGGGLFFVEPHLHTPYSYQYNLSLQHELARNLTFEVNYVGSSSKGLTALVDVNPFVPGTTANTVNPVRVLNVNQPNGGISGFCAANYSAADCPLAIEPEFGNVSFASYNSLEASLTKRLGDSRFFGTTYFTLGYTYGRSIDNASGFRNRNSQVPSYDHGALRGPSDFDLAQRLTFSGGWDLPFDRAWSDGPKRLTTGWSLYPILTWRTGFPLGVNAGLTGDPSVPGPSGAGDGYLANAVFSPGYNRVTILNAKNPATFGGVSGNYYFDPGTFSSNVTSAAPYGLPRNNFYGPHLTNLDLALAKTTSIHENVNLEFRAEAFNLFNHTEFTQPDTNIFSPTFGQITNTLLNADGSRSERILQLAMRLTF